MSRLKHFIFICLWPLDTTSTVIFNLSDPTWSFWSDPCTRAPSILFLTNGHIFFSRSIKQAGGRPSGPVLMWLTSRSCRPSSIYWAGTVADVYYFHIFLFLIIDLSMHWFVHVVIWDVHPSIPSSFFIISLINWSIHSCNVSADCLLACLLPCLFSILACLNCLLDFSYFACLLRLRAWCMLSFSAACPCMDTMLTESYNQLTNCLILYPHITSLYLGTCSVWGDQRSVSEMLVHSGDQP